MINLLVRFFFFLQDQLCPKFVFKHNLNNLLLMNMLKMVLFHRQQLTS